MPVAKLSADQIQSELASVPGWQLVSGSSLLRRFHFHSFPEAFAFMTAIAIHAEKMNHHPDMRSVYTLVEIILSTHDAGGLTTLDFALARRISALATGAHLKNDA
jgi:4a-hydroxytetrahydrobiopterin dehydratase